MRNRLSILILAFTISTSFVLNAQPNVKPDNKIGKKEFEIALLAGASDRGALAGAQLTYRFPVGCKFKFGGGVHFSVDETGKGSHPGFFFDLSKFIGNKQKWKFTAQVGKAFYETSDQSNGVNGATYHSKINKEVFYHINAVYRMNLSRKVTFFAGHYFLLQTFEVNTEVKDGLGQTLNPIKGRSKDGGGGIRFGLVF